ncbi:MAG: HEAT repeat domain-containing protein, partial [Gemmatimonadota bacterium]
MPKRSSPAILGLLVAACAGVAPPPPSAPVPVGPTPLTDREVGIVARLVRHEDERRLDSLAFRAWQADSNPEIRRRAALAIGRIGDRSGTDLLLGALGDSTATVRREAAFALGELGDTSAAVTTALADVLTDEPRVAAEAAAALGKLPTFAAFDELWPVLADP